jgi:hypothetical protein
MSTSSDTSEPEDRKVVVSITMDADRAHDLLEVLSDFVEDPDSDTDGIYEVTVKAADPPVQSDTK